MVLAVSLYVCVFGVCLCEFWKWLSKCLWPLSESELNRFTYGLMELR